MKKLLCYLITILLTIIQCTGCSDSIPTQSNNSAKQKVETTVSSVEQNQEKPVKSDESNEKADATETEKATESKKESETDIAPETEPEQDKTATMLPTPDNTTPSSGGDISISITAVGDCTFGTDINSASGKSFDNEYKENNNDATYFLRNVKPYFENDDLTIVNFEGTLSSRGTRANKQFAFRGNPDYINILTSASVEAANLANNHSRDYGEISMSDTKQIMTDNNILHFEGSNLAVTEINGIKIGLMGTNTQRDGSKATLLKNIETLKAHNPDLIIASFHWGEESKANPNSKQIELAHAAIDSGVDLVIGHHPHVLQGIEKYKGKYILYSLGNFCFGGNRNPSDKDTMIFKQTFLFSNKELISGGEVSIIPCSISSETSRNNYQPTALSGESFIRVKNKIKERSKNFPGIEDISFMEGKPTE